MKTEEFQLQQALMDIIQKVLSYKHPYTISKKVLTQQKNKDIQTYSIINNQTYSIINHFRWK